MNQDVLMFEQFINKSYIFNKHTGEVYLLNETATKIVEGIYYEKLDQIIHEILNEYNITRDKLLEDITEIQRVLTDL